MKKQMSANELYHYKRFRECGAACIACLGLVTLFGIMFTVALMYKLPKTCIAIACAEVMIVFVAQVKSCDADRHYKRAFPDDDMESPFRL